MNISPILKNYESVLNLPLLTETEEKQLCSRAANGDVNAQNTLFERNTRLVLTIVEKYHSYTLDAEDLYQAGLCGLLTAIKKFDPTKNTRFSTYAYCWITQNIERTIVNEDNTIRIPNNVYTATVKISKFEKQFQMDCGRLPSNQEIAEALGMAEEKVATYLLERNKKKISLDGTYGVDDGDEFYNLITSSDYHPAIDPVEIDTKSDQEAVVRSLMCCLTPRQSDVICRRFGLLNEVPETLETIADQYGCTRERIRQLESEAIDSMKTYALKNNIRFDL